MTAANKAKVKETKYKEIYSVYLANGYDFHKTYKELGITPYHLHFIIKRILSAENNILQ